VAAGRRSTRVRADGGVMAMLKLARPRPGRNELN
jgi:hypothetical protein